MFGLSYSEFVQGSALRTWNCVAHFASLFWYKFNHLRDPIMPRSRRRHHSRSRSRSRSHSHDRDREPKRRKIESYDSPHHKRSVSSEPEAVDYKNELGIDEPDTQNDLISSKEQSSTIDSKDINSGNENDKEFEKMEIKETIPPSPRSSKAEYDGKNGNHNALADTIEDIEAIDNQGSKPESSNLITDKNVEKDSNDSDVEEVRNDSNELKSNSHADDVENNVESPEEGVIKEKGNVKNNTPNKIVEKAKDLKITPNKVLSPKQLQKKLESEKKRQDKQKEKEEKERQKLEEKEEKKRKKTEELRKITEEKMRLKQEKEEQKMKEKIAKEEKKKKEQEEKDKKRREREEKEEQKKKEREQEKLKKQQELEEKNKEKLKIEEQKQKTAAAFANFFLSKKSDSTEGKKPEESLAFMPFEVKSDMRLAPIKRRDLESIDKKHLDQELLQQDENKLYLAELKQGKEIGKSGKTWSFEDIDQEDDVVIVEDNFGERIEEETPKFEKMRAKFFKFDENQRPPYFGTFKKRSKSVRPRRPFAKDNIFNYEVDSDDEWEEEGEGESIIGTDDEEKENDSDEYEVDNEFFVPHAYLSDDEIDDEANAKLSPESHKAKLKLLKNEFDEEMKSKTQKIKPRVIGCIWYDKTKSKVEEAIDRYLQPFSIICNGQIEIRKRSEFAPATVRKVPKQLSKEHVPIFLKIIHGSADKRINIVESFIEYMSNNGIQVEVSKASLGKQFKKLAQWQRCPEEGTMHNKMCWYVGEDIRKEYNVDLSLPKKISNKRNKSK